VKSAIASSVAVIVAIVLLENILVVRYFTQLPRLTTDFSPAYLQRELQLMAQGPPPTIFLGDSVVWGYQLQPSQTAVSELASRGCVCRNLAFEGGSPPNYYALVRLLLAAGVRPKIVVMQVNQKVFSQSDPAYQRLQPALAELTAPQKHSAIGERFGRALASIWLVYAMRADIRETLLGDSSAPEPRHPSAALFEGAYDATPLNARNAGVYFLQKTAAELRAARIPAVAFMTPTNHTLLHEYIDTPEYRANGAYLQRLLERQGVVVLDLDAAYPANEFFDNDHLTAAGQRRLAALLAPALNR
jgi:lysophospholipase L1-like esterase